MDSVSLSNGVVMILNANGYGAEKKITLDFEA